MARYFFHNANNKRPDVLPDWWVATVDRERPSNLLMVKHLSDRPHRTSYDAAGITIYLDGVQVQRVTSFDTDEGWVWKYRERWNDAAQCFEMFMDPETLDVARERLTGVVTFEWVYQPAIEVEA